MIIRKKTYCKLVEELKNKEQEASIYSKRLRENFDKEVVLLARINRLETMLIAEREKNEADSFNAGLSEGYDHLEKCHLKDAVATYKQKCNILEASLRDTQANLRNAEKGNIRLSSENKRLTSQLKTNMI